MVNCALLVSCAVSCTRVCVCPCICFALLNPFLFSFIFFYLTCMLLWSPLSHSFSLSLSLDRDRDRSIDQLSVGLDLELELIACMVAWCEIYSSPRCRHDRAQLGCFRLAPFLLTASVSSYTLAIHSLGPS